MTDNARLDLSQFCQLLDQLDRSPPLAVWSELLASNTGVGTDATSYSHVRGWANAAGVTRLAETTQMDRLGIPTFSAIRPDAVHPLSIISNGKGLTTARAALSALFESYERWCCEASDGLPVCFCSQADWEHFNPRVPLVLCPAHAQHDQIEWTMGFDLFTGRAYAVPMATVLFPAPSESRHLLVAPANTTGLAAHATLADAAKAGFAEVVERHALAEFGSAAPLRLALDSLGREVAELATHFADADITLSVHCICRLAGLFVVYAIARDDYWRVKQMVCSGWGAAATLNEAAFRAVIEIAQSRVSFITALRDDVAGTLHARSKTFSELREATMPWFEGKCHDGEQVSSLSHSNTDWCDTGVGPAVCVQLRQSHSLPAVRVVAPHLRGASGR